MKFDGAGDYLSIPWDDDFDIGNKDYTIEAWIKTAGGIGEIVSAFERGGKHKGWLFAVGYCCGHDDKIVFKGYGNGIRDVVYSNASVNDNEWHHVAFLKDNDSTTNKSTYAFYIDGKFDKSGELKADIIEPGGETIYIGRANNATPNERYFNGYIDSVRITKEKSQFGNRYSGPFTPPTVFAPRSTPAEPNRIDPQFLQIKTIIGEGNVSVRGDDLHVYISGSGIAATDVSNIGTGSGIYSGRTGDQLKFRKIFRKWFC